MIKIPTWFWVIAVIALIWNLLGVMAFLMHINISPEMLASMSAEEQKLYADTPLWSKVAFGIAVFAGAIASIMLLMKKKLSSMIFTISLLAVLAQQFYIFFVSNTMQVLGYGQAVMPAIVIIIAVALVHFANSCRKKRWIN